MLTNQKAKSAQTPAAKVYAKNPSFTRLKMAVLTENPPKRKIHYVFNENNPKTTKMSKNMRTNTQNTPPNAKVHPENPQSENEVALKPL